MIAALRHPHDRNEKRDSDPMWNEHRDIGVWENLTDRIMGAVEILADAESKEHVLSTVAYFLSEDMSPGYLCPNPKRLGRYGYAAPGANPEPGSYIVDAGACSGDMTPEWLRGTGNNCHIYAIEPVTKNTHPSPHVTWIPCGLGRVSGTGAIVRQNCEATRTKVSGGMPGGVLISRLDDLFEGKPFDYLKMDIEGAELDALEGGRNVIRRYRPTLAVCGYHRPFHWAAVPELLKRLLAPCQIYASHDPDWFWNTHYIAVPDERAA